MSDFLKWLLGIGPGDEAADSWRLRFVADYDDYVKLVMVVALAALVFLVVRSYRREGQTSRRGKVILASLRMLVIVLVFLLLLRPAVVLKFTETTYAAVVVLLDDSESMAQVDGYTDGPERARAERVAALLGVEPEAMRKLSRQEIVRRVLDRPSGALAELARDHNLLIMRFSPASSGDESYTERLQVLSAVGAGDWAGGEGHLPALRDALAGLKARGRTTDLARALAGALQETVGQRVSGVVIATDGQATEENPAPAIAQARQQAQERGIPVCAVGVGDTTARHRNIAVTGVRATSPRVRVGSRVTFTVQLRHSRFDGEDVVVYLRRKRPNEDAWEQVAQSEPLRLAGGGEAASTTRPARRGERQPAGRQSVTIALEPDVLGKALGLFDYQAYVKVQDAETKADDNAAQTTLRVCPDKINVLLIGHAGWEFQYLRNFLLREGRPGPDGKWEEVFRVTVWQQDADKGLNQDASTGMKLARLPRDLEQLIGSPKGTPFPGYDIVILYDPIPTDGGFDEHFVKLLKSFVQEHGGGLCYVAGQQHTEITLLATKAFGDLADLLPVRIGSSTDDTLDRIRHRTPKPYPVYLTPYGVAHPLARMGATGPRAGGVWNVLPGIYWSHPVEKVKPLAQVLAVNSNPVRRTADDEPEPVLVIQSAGAGRCLYVGFDSTWRWRFLREAYYFRTFWKDVVNFLAPLRIRQVAVTTPKPQYDLGERVPLEVEAYDEKFQPVTADTYAVIVTHTEDRAVKPRRVELQAVDAVRKPGLYKGVLEALEVGKYLIQPAVPIPEERVDDSRIEVVRRNPEQRHPEADVSTLEHPLGLATRPENFLPIEDIDRLPGLIPSGRMQFSREEPRGLLDSVPLAATTLAVLVILLAVEWIVRKRYNMT